MTVMVTLPFDTAVANPEVALMLAMEGLLELQAT
jgi:hypothetical protein